MDESFLSQPEIVSASREFVCVRLATYEDAEEAKLLRKIYLGRSGELENTVFAILSPDGTRQLVRSGRSPHFSFRSPSDMAATMKRITEKYAAKNADIEKVLPKMATVRLALNVAACDRQPLIVVRGANVTELSTLEDRIAGFAWSDDFIGQFAYGSTIDAKELANISDLDSQSKILVVQPDQYGQKGSVVAQLDASASDQELADALNFALTVHHRPTGEHRSHVVRGRSKSVHWETAIPVTDRGRSPGRRGR